MEDFDDPVGDWSSHFRDLHAKLVGEHFEKLVVRSGVDEQQNVRTVAELRVLEARQSDDNAARKRWRIARAVSVVAVIALVAVALIQKGPWLFAFVPAAGLTLLVFLKVNPEIAHLNQDLGVLAQQVKAKSDEAWAQMEPLNRLFTWDTAPALLQATHPGFALDRYLTADRLADLQSTYGLESSFIDGRSVLSTLSGTNNGNPFVLTRYLHHWMGLKTYTGSIVISWSERVRDVNGNWTTQMRTETLTASVDHPFPEYRVGTTLLFGHEAAPDLVFNRVPSKLSGSMDDDRSHRRLERSIKKIEKKARKEITKGDGQLTVMANREFEALFNAVDRNDETQFRLLFTPLAQQEMVRLLNDRTVGNGDDFSFSKQRRMNLIETKHLADLRTDADPAMFRSLELARARTFFADFHAAWFKAIYFAFAPLWTIPLYRDRRSLPGGPSAQRDRTSSNWEHEVMSNLIGEDRFRHPESATSNILRTAATVNPDGTSDVTVVAHGYKGIPQVDFVPVLGGDLKVHQVPVHWTEYLPVQNQTRILVSSVQDPSLSSAGETDQESVDRWVAAVRARGLDPYKVWFRNGLAAAVVG